MKDSHVIDQDLDELIINNANIINKIKDKTTLVTGATGSIGSYVVYFLSEAIERSGGSGKVIANVRNEQKALLLFDKYMKYENFELFVSDINSINKIPHKLDYIIHTASPTQPQDFQERPVDIIRANVHVTDSLLEMANSHQAKLCMLSTLETYGVITSPRYPVYVKEEDFGALDATDLRSVYPESKRLAESLCVAHEKQYGTKSVIIRLGPVISPILDPADMRVYAQFIHFATKGQDIEMFSDAFDKKRSYTYVADIVTGILTALLDKSNSIFNLANNDNVVSIGKLAEEIVHISGDDIKLNINERDDTSNTSTSTGAILLDSTKLINSGWKPLFSIEDCIAKTLQQSTLK